MKKKVSQSRSFLRFAAIATAAFVLFLFVKRDNVIRWVQAGFTIREQQKRIECLKAEISDMEQRVDNLTGNRDTLETYAREHFKFSEPGEDVYLIDE